MAEVQQAQEGDAALVLAARRGDTEAFARLLDRHGALLRGLCRRALDDPGLAADAAQEAALRALLNLGQLRRPERFGGWLGSIGLNVCRSWLRERSREAWSWQALQGGQWGREPVDWQSEPEELAEAADVAARVRRAVAELPDGQRAAVLLFYLSELTHAETAAQLGIRVGAVKARLHKARAALRRQLWNAWGEGDVASESADTATGVQMQVGAVHRTAGNGDQPSRHVVVLEEVGGDRRLLMWIGPFEAAAMAVLLERADTGRPLTYTFAANVLQAAGGRLRQVRVSRLAETTYYAVAVIEGAHGTRNVDARPSDALSLALVLGAPIFVEPGVLAAAERCRPPDCVQPSELASRLAGSTGAAGMVAELQEQWRIQRRSWEQPAE